MNAIRRGEEEPVKNLIVSKNHVKCDTADQDGNTIWHHVAIIREQKISQVTLFLLVFVVLKEFRS
jgi:hypothetical protein